MEFLVVLLVGSIFINLIILNDLVKRQEQLNVFVEKANDFIRAFDDVKKTVNGNNELYALWGKEIKEHSKIIASMFNILQIHSYALRLTPPDDKLLEYSDEVTPPIE